MKKITLSIFVIFSFGFYVIWQNFGNSQTAFVASSTVSTKKSTQVATTTDKTPTQAVTIPTPPKKKGQYNDGSYVGDVADAYYGNVQVKAIISNGKLVNVQFLDYPQDQGTSRRKNLQAMPILIQEAISAQSANVDGVSGASATSGAFVQSLSSALVQAKS